MRTNNQFKFNLLWHDALSNYPVSLQQEVFTAVIKYAATGNLPVLHDPQAQIAFDFIRTEIDARQAVSENPVVQQSITSKQRGTVLSPACFEPEETMPVKKDIPNELIENLDDLDEEEEYNDEEEEDDEDYEEDYDDYEDDCDEDYEDMEEEDDEDDYEDYEYDYPDDFSSLRDFRPITKLKELDSYETICSFPSARKSGDDKKTQPVDTDPNPVEARNPDAGTIREVSQPQNSLRHEIRHLKKKFRLPFSAKCLNKSTNISGGSICSRAGPDQGTQKPKAMLST